MKHPALKHLILLVPIGILLFVQIPNLSLPYFWDEAWSYITAIKAMADAGPTLLPGAASIHLYKGHPQLFFFISSTWMKLVNANIVGMRLFPLSISIGVLLTSYIGLLKLANWPTAAFSVILIAVQTVFLAQSIFFLPEMLLTLFLILSFFFFLNRKYAAYAFSATLMVFTKETAIVFAVTFGLFYLFSLLNKKKHEKFKPLHLLALLTPGLLYALFLLLHYRAYGVLFYSEHLNHVAHDWSTVQNKLSTMSSFIFIQYGKTAITIITLLTSIILFFKKEADKRPIILAIVLFVFFISFSIFNFFTLRYSLPLIVLLMILTAYNVGQLKLNNIVKWTAIVLISVVCLTKTQSKKENSDINLGYVETINVFQDLTNYCIENNWQDERIASTFNMIYNLSEPELGYVNNNNKFTNIVYWKKFIESKYLILESTSSHDEATKYANEHFQLLKSIENRHAWGYVYLNPDYIKPD